MQTGTVKFFDEARGYGFITRDDGGRDIFVHINGLLDRSLETLQKGQRVRFEEGTDARSGKPEALKVVIAGGKSDEPEGEASPLAMTDNRSSQGQK
jgi:cold shock protein